MELVRQERGDVLEAFRSDGANATSIVC